MREIEECEGRMSLCLTDFMAQIAVSAQTLEAKLLLEIGKASDSNTEALKVFIETEVQSVRDMISHQEERRRQDLLRSINDTELKID